MKVKKIRISTNKRINSQTIGNYRSAFKGSGMNFSEIRRYYFGDDIRNIAWGATAKNRKIFVKDYKEDRALNIIIVIDTSASMEFYSKISKKEYIAYIAASLAFSAFKAGDKIGGVFFNTRLQHFIRPKNTQRNVLEIVDKILCAKYDEYLDYEKLQSFLYKTLKETSAIFLFSDFINPNSKIEKIGKIFKQLNIKHLFIPICINDRLERNMISLGIFPVKAMEENKIKDVVLDSFTLKKYNKNMELYLNDLNDNFRKNNINSIHFEVGEDFDKKLNDYFKRQKSFH